MLKIKIIATGKIKEPALGAMIGEYVKRLGKYCTLGIIEVHDESIPAKEGQAVIEKRIHAEAVRILERLKPDSYVIALDVGGDAPDSNAFAQKLGGLTGRYVETAFIIGGSHGLHESVLARADYVMSMSNLTFPHQMARLIIMEQIYRAFKILSKETYHK